MNWPTSYVSVDVETTGLFPNRGEKIIQLSAAKYVDDKLVDTFDTLVNPEGVLNVAATMNNIPDILLLDKPKFKDIVGDFVSFVGDSIWLGHNLSFDLRFLKSEGLDTTPFERGEIDTLTLARRTFGNSKNQLWRLEKRFDVENEEQHNSLCDAIATAKVYQKLRDIVPPKKTYHRRHVEYKKHIIADPKDHVLENTRIVFTGHFDYDTRDNLRHLVEEHGGKSPNTVSKATDFLVLGVQTSHTKDPIHSAKELKAMEYGTPIITIDDFLDMLGGK